MSEKKGTNTSDPILIDDLYGDPSDFTPSPLPEHPAPQTETTTVPELRSLIQMMIFHIHLLRLSPDILCLSLFPSEEVLLNDFNRLRRWRNSSST
jgi:hypothetical protein